MELHIIERSLARYKAERDHLLAKDAHAGSQSAH
jgi:hypothetical protein